VLASPRGERERFREPEGFGADNMTARGSQGEPKSEIQ